MSDHEQDTIAFKSARRFAETFFSTASPASASIRLDFGAATHTGKVRSNNEDHYVVIRRRRLHELLLGNLRAEELTLTDDSAFGMVVADGMGGANFGEFASRLAIERMFELSQQATSWVMKFTGMDEQQIRQRVEAYVQEMQHTLREYVAANPPLAGMGTTWTSAHLIPPHVIIVHVGDSRAYHLHRGELYQITRDDTVAQAYIDAGVDAQTAKKYRHLLLNSFGGDTDAISAQIYLLEVVPGDKLLLCTDGLTDMLSDREITSVLTRSSTPQAVCDSLVRRALDEGGRDNVTVVLASVGLNSGD